MLGTNSAELLTDLLHQNRIAFVNHDALLVVLRSILLELTLESIHGKPCDSDFRIALRLFHGRLLLVELDQIRIGQHQVQLDLFLCWFVAQCQDVAQLQHTGGLAGPAASGDVEMAALLLFAQLSNQRKDDLLVLVRPWRFVVEEAFERARPITCQQFVHSRIGFLQFALVLVDVQSSFNRMFAKENTGPLRQVLIDNLGMLCWSLDTLQ